MFRKQDLLRSDWGSCQNRDAGEAAPSNGNDIPRRVTASVESIGGLEKRFSTVKCRFKLAFETAPDVRIIELE